MTQERELGWDDQIVKDGTDFVLLPAGDYNFTVKKFDRGRFNGSAKMPPCNQAKLEIAVHSPEHGEVIIFHNLFLHTKTEGLLSNFFSGIGQKKEGQPLQMNWNTVVGSTGRLQLEVNNFTGYDGQTKTNNQIKKFYPKQAQTPQQGYTQPQQGYQQPPQQNTGGYQQGVF